MMMVLMVLMLVVVVLLLMLTMMMMVVVEMMMMLMTVIMMIMEMKILTMMMILMTLIELFFYYDNAGAHAPSKPHVQVIGRHEMHINWEPPEVPLGRITRYDLSMNSKTVYSGMELSFAALRLTPDTEYTFVVGLACGG